METISGSGFRSGPSCELVGVDKASGLSLAPATEDTSLTSTSLRNAEHGLTVAVDASLSQFVDHGHDLWVQFGIPSF